LQELPGAGVSLRGVDGGVAVGGGIVESADDVDEDRPRLSWSRVAAAAAKPAGSQYPGRIAISGLNRVVRAASAVATVKVSGRPQPVPSSAPPQPWSSAARASSVEYSMDPQPDVVSSPR
jgi:hypothetical protein